MPCGLYKYIRETPDYWVGKSGKHYKYGGYENHGRKGMHNGKMRFPKDDFPYMLVYKKELVFTCCKICKCEGKEKEHYVEYEDVEK